MVLVPLRTLLLNRNFILEFNMNKPVTLTDPQRLWVRNALDLKKDQIRRAANQHPDGSRARLAMLDDLAEVDKISDLFL